MYYFKEIDKFLRLNDEKRIEQYLSMLIDKLTLINKKIDRITFYLILTICGYILLSSPISFSINIGSISLNDPSTLKMVTPAVSAYLIFQYIVLGNESAELTTSVKYVFSKYNKVTLSRAEKTSSINANNIMRMILPYSFWGSMNAYIKRSNLFGVIIFLPLITCLFFSPIIFTIYATYNTYNNFSHNVLAICSVVISLWLLIASIYFFYLGMMESNKRLKQMLPYRS